MTAGAMVQHADDYFQNALSRPRPRRIGPVGVFVESSKAGLP